MYIAILTNSMIYIFYEKEGNECFKKINYNNMVATLMISDKVINLLNSIKIDKYFISSSSKYIPVTKKISEEILEKSLNYLENKNKILEKK